MTEKAPEELQFISLPGGDDGTPQVPGGSFAPGGGAQAGGDGLIGGVMREAKHPMACLFHVLFKALSLFFYMFGGWFTSNEVFVFVLILVSLACDFWTVKVSSSRSSRLCAATAARCAHRARARAPRTLVRTAPPAFSPSPRGLHPLEYMRARAAHACSRLHPAR